MAEHGAAKVGGGDTESYGCVDRAFSTHAFDVRRGVAGLHRVGAFLRHRAPDRMYELETRCGRAVTLTGDHNLWVLRDGMPVLVRTDEALATDCVPVPETMGSTGDLRVLDVLPYLSGTKLSVFADESVLAYVASGGQAEFADVIRASGLNPYAKLFAIRNGIRGRGIKVYQFIRLGLYHSAAQMAGASAASSSAAVSLPHCPFRTKYFACLAITLRKGIRSRGTSCCPTVIRCCVSALKVPGEPGHPVPHPCVQRLFGYIHSTREVAQQVVWFECLQQSPA
ncbi:MAG: hypothetical protein IPJ97_18370 [Proteobacteria bacterium]|nr:hypothetical protein [Pseudomonadota bacterium]